jgi:hypothetical protein
MRISLLLHVLMIVKGLASPTQPDSRGQLQTRWHLLTRFLTFPYQPSRVDIHSTTVGTEACYTREQQARAMPLMYGPLQLFSACALQALP